MTKTQLILAKDYTQLLTKIRNCIGQTEQEIVSAVTRQKVVMAWQIGELIGKHLATNKADNYHKLLFEKLEKDLGFTKTVFYKMHAFYKSYPTLPKNDDKLNWSHYRILSGVKESAERPRHDHHRQRHVNSYWR